MSWYEFQVYSNEIILSRKDYILMTFIRRIGCIKFESSLFAEYIDRLC